MLVFKCKVLEIIYTVFRAFQLKIVLEQGIDLLRKWIGKLLRLVWKINKIRQHKIKQLSWNIIPKFNHKLIKKTLW